jgi:hypothetical protein
VSFPHIVSAQKPASISSGRPARQTGELAPQKPPRWGFTKGFLVGLVIEVPVLAAAVWVLAELGIGDPSVGYMRLLRFTTVFAGIAAVLTAAGIGRLAAHASVQPNSGRRRATFVAARAHAAAGAGLILIAAIPHGHLPHAHWHWLFIMAAGAVSGAACGAAIGVVCGGASNALGGVVALARRPTKMLQAILYPEELVKLGAAVRTRTSTLFEGFFDPVPPAPAPARPNTGKVEPGSGRAASPPAEPAQAPATDPPPSPTPPADDSS